MKIDSATLVGLLGVAATLITGLLAVYFTKKGLKKQKLSYELKLYPIISEKLLKTSDFKVYYKDDILPEPTLLIVNIKNTGNTSIENPPIEIEAVGSTYVLPGYIEDIPPGYENKWILNRIDAEICTISLEHINPKQTIKARFLLDENPKEGVVFKCPMKDLVLVKTESLNSELSVTFGEIFSLVIGKAFLK